MEYSNDQKTALEAFTEYLDSEEQVFVVKGSAGSGKTTLVKAFTKTLRDKSVPVRLMAPTGRAAMILAEKTGYEASTIHKAIYRIEEKLQPDGNGKMKFGLHFNDDSDRTVYFVDEASMISDVNSENDLFQFGSGNLLNDLLSYCGSRKIVFVGDYAQLPPVGQNISPALDVDYLTERYHLKCRETILREVLRQVSESAVFKNAVSIRDAIESDNFCTFSVNDGQEVTKSDSLLDDYRTETGGGIDENAIIIASTNLQVMEYNLAVRKMVFAGQTERLVPGDLLLICQNNYSYAEELFNGSIIRVLECDPDGLLEKRNVRFNTAEKDANGKAVVKETTLSFRRVKIETPRHEQLSCLILDDFLTDTSGHLMRFHHQALMADFNNRMRENHVKAGSETYLSMLRTDKYLHALVCKYGYALTCHKAQGGEWDKVFVDMDKFGGKQNSDYFRWAYTAITRSRNQLWHFASPEFSAVSQMKVQPISRGGNISYYTPSGEHFMDWRYAKIVAACDLQDICCTDDRSKAYQHIIRFEKGEDYCVFQLWYNSKGYSAKQNVMGFSNQEFVRLAEEILMQSTVPDQLPFEPKTDFAIRLHEHILDVANELGIMVLNVTQEQWRDVYHLLTKPFVSVVGFNYNGKGMYSSVVPQSSGGNEDELLKAFCDRLLQ